MSKKTTIKKPKPSKPAVPAPEKPQDAPVERDGRMEPTELVKALQVFYDLRDGSWMTLLNNRYVNMKKSDLQMRFRALGLRDDLYVKTKDKGSLRELDYPFYIGQNERMIDFAGAIAGRRVGQFRDSVGRKFLVTDEAGGVWDDLIKNPKPVFFPDFVLELLGEEQAMYFFYWLAIALRAMREQSFSPGQCLILAGPPRCGKSLLQLFISEILGGRSANPFDYLMGEKFNKDLQVAEHWMVEDPGTSTDIRTRRLFGEKIKEATVNRDIRVNGKGKDAGKLQVFRRVTISVNSEAEAIAVCPPMVEGVKDKIMLKLCNQVSKAFDRFRDKHGVFKQVDVWAFFMAEIPAIRSWLLEKFKRVPSSLVDERMGIVAYHNPELMAELSSMTYESRYLELIDEQFFPPDDKDSVRVPIEKLSAQWLKELLNHNRFEVEKVVRSPGQSGAHLAKLCKSNPERVSRRTLDGRVLWTIKPPSQIEDKNQLVLGVTTFAVDAKLVTR